MMIIMYLMFPGPDRSQSFLELHISNSITISRVHLRLSASLLPSASQPGAAAALQFSPSLPRLPPALPGSGLLGAELPRHLPLIILLRPLTTTDGGELQPQQSRESPENIKNF